MLSGVAAESVLGAGLSARRSDQSLQEDAPPHRLAIGRTKLALSQELVGNYRDS